MNHKRIMRNVRDGHHVNSNYWKNYRRAMPPLPPALREIATGMILGDASVSKRSLDGEAHIKFEQGRHQRALIQDLFNHFQAYCSMVAPQLYRNREGVVKSAWFRTFGHQSISDLHDLFYERRGDRYRKIIKEGLVREHLTPRGLAYWIMSDGSRRHRVTILHTAGFTRRENEILATELHEKFGLCPKVIPHKDRYWVLRLASSDGPRLTALVRPWILPTMAYKLWEEKSKK